MLRKLAHTFILGLASLFAFSSCNDTIDTQQQRREDNEKAFRSFQGKSGYSRVSIPGIYGDNYIYMKYVTRGTGTVKPIATDNVRRQYTGYLTTDWVKDGDAAESFDSNTTKTVIDPSKVSGDIIGMAIALQNMVVGDDVEVVIPWYLGYGAASISSIPSYSSLFFKVKLVEIIK